VDGNSADDNGAPSESPGLELPPEADSKDALPRRFAFPNFKQTRQLADKREISQRSEDRSAVTASNLDQDADARAASPDGFKVPAIKSDRIPLPNPFQPLSAAGDARTDAFTLVPVADIIVGERLRGVVEAFVPTMVGSMSNNEVIQPPVVRPDRMNPGKYLLVAGLQRVNATRVRGADVILCRVVELTDVEAILWEIDENLVRAPLSAAQEALFIDRRRELHERRHGKSKSRGALAANTVMGRSGDASAKLADASFTAETAKKTGRSERAIQRVIQRAAQNGPSNLARVAGTSLDRAAELDALPLLPRATQELLINQATTGAKVSAMQARREMLAVSGAPESPDAAAASQQPPVSNNDDDVCGLSELKTAWFGASDSEREAFLAWITDTGQFLANGRSWP
jgi:hypothetical protein